MAFQGALSDKIPLVLYVIAMGISGLVVAFIRGWLLTLVLFGAFPVTFGSMYLYMYNVQHKGKRELKSYAVAGGRAEQALSSIKTVKMLNGEEF
jgi:ATP-binding cassette subfamily B (MDR/TAP) protein 1